MIFQSNNQASNLIIFLFWGIIIGIVAIFYFLFFVKNFQKKLIKLIIFAIFYSFFIIFFVFLINFLNFGKFSFVLLFSFCVGYIWVKKLTHKLVVIMEKRWYTILNKLFKHNSRRKGKTIKDERTEKS